MVFNDGCPQSLSAEVARRYVDTLKAPQKAFVVVEAAGHDTNQEIIDAEYKLLMERIMPLTK